MDLLLKDKSAVVTGASGGIGKAIAEELANEGAQVVISSRNEEKLQKAASEIREKTGNTQIQYAVCDVRDEQAIRSLIQKAADVHDTVDVLINNAGGPPAGGFLDMKDEDWYNAFDQNLLSVVRATKFAIPYMKDNGGGRIVNITSSSIKQSIDNLMLSNTMRPGVYGLTKTLAAEFAKDNILVNTIGPGKIATDRISELMEMNAKKSGMAVQELEEKALSEIPMGRLGEPEEFAKAAVFFASFANTYVTGQALIVDGASVKAL